MKIAGELESLKVQRANRNERLEAMNVLGEAVRARRARAGLFVSFVASECAVRDYRSSKMRFFA